MPFFNTPNIDKQRLTLRARWLFSVDAEPIENGIIEIEQGKIVAIHNKNDPAATDLGNVALIPGLVNCHTHLELSDLSRPIEYQSSFARWIQSVITHRQQRNVTSNEICQQGMQESVACGTTLMGDIVSSDWNAEITSKPHSQTIAFLELIGLLPEQQQDQITLAKRHLDTCHNQNHSDILAGLSPHAPYSVHIQLLKEIANLAVERNVPLAMHLAETTAEIELLQTGTGLLVEMLTKFGLWRSDLIPASTTPLDYLKILSTAPRALVVHGNYLSEKEIDFLAAHPQLSTIYCPRTHAYFGHSAHPWLQLINKGANVALGTDSRASNPDLSLWQELLYLHRTHPHVSAELILKLGTLAGASAFGLEAETGSLQVGKQADLAVISLPETSNTAPALHLLQSDNIVVATMKEGRWIYKYDSGQHSTHISK